ncbi:MFS transporter [Pseudomonas sp. GL-B-16]|uniref:MFS transporter n=1 Tax=Pseudomonas sp. GL-B-16 TaxID=2832373 RepID=UPI001CBFEEF5|nr:MFS transporter [Pseudomonas sp. GL-B-16]
MREHILDASAAAAETSMPRTVSAGDIAARLDRLPATRSVWSMVLLLSLGSFFEFYELLSTAYVMPGMIKSGIFSTTTESIFGMTGAASYIAATFIGIFIGVLLFGKITDRLGRRAVFTYALLGYSTASCIMGFQSDAHALNLWRLVGGVFIGVEIITIDSYLSEIVPARIRGRAFAVLRMCSFAAVPVAALIAYLLVPATLLGYEGWRWVFWIGSCGALFIWVLRRGLPESPRWLVSRGRFDEADAVLCQLEAKVKKDHGRALPKPEPIAVLNSRESVHFAGIWSRPYRTRTIMLLVCQVGINIALYGFSNWMPTLLIEHGIGITKSLEYSLIISCVYPLGPLMAIFFADRFERKWQLLGAGVLLIIGGLLFVEMRSMLPLILAGSAVTLVVGIAPMVVHTYQNELYPTRHRAFATGVVVAVGRLGGAVSGFVIAAALKYAGVSGALIAICGAMTVAVMVVVLFGPRTRGRSLEELNR